MLDRVSKRAKWVAKWAATLAGVPSAVVAVSILQMNPARGYSPHIIWSGAGKGKRLDEASWSELNDAAERLSLGCAFSPLNERGRELLTAILEEIAFRQGRQRG